MTAFREAFPILLVDDVERASAFYTSTLGFEEAYRNEDEHGLEFVFLALEPYGIGLARRAEGEGRDFASGSTPTTSTPPPPTFARPGRRRSSPPTDQPWGERMCTFIDPNGHLVQSGWSCELAAGRRQARARARADGRAGVEALVVRAPDNVLYLTNFWG